MSPITAPQGQSQTASNDENVDVRGSSLILLQVPREKAAGLKKWKSLTRMFDSKEKSSPSLRQTSLAINTGTANSTVPCDIGDLTDSDFTQSLCYSPELAAIVSSGGRSKRWAFCLTPTPSEFEQSNQFSSDSLHRDEGVTSNKSTESEDEGIRRPTLYLILDPDQDPSCSSEVIMLVGTKEEIGGKTGGGDVLEKGS
ncbi:hypothetical protein BDM02DRAFT_2022110 [Thelephora ganbajun]|uniref:Uncharacterized protein n=1 Tax=Thelephora ganbajun TaxID=370292 RepID=A0ACB6ZHA9_THEGA|nr:hypothetical protein BDM02DRAFT_2022110 [Thelephora ganbajun]